MSLIHWWPFNNNTTDSITSLSLTGSVTYATGGKVTPNALKSTSTLTSTTLLSKLSPLNNGFSFACWLKINQNEIKTHFNSITSSYTMPTGTLIGYNNYGGTALIWKANSLTSFSKIYIEGTIRGNTSYVTPQYEMPFDQWVHITMVKDAVSKKIILYINGVEVKSTSIANLTSVSYLNQYISINRNIIAYNNGPATILPCYLNDVRVYDHALSPREVKLLAQGLVAHYKLDNEQPNLIQGGYGDKSKNNYLVHTYPFDYNGFGRYLDPATDDITLTVCFTPTSAFQSFIPHFCQGWCNLGHINSDGTTNKQIQTLTKKAGNWNWVGDVAGNIIPPSTTPANADLQMYSTSSGSANVTIHWVKLQIGDHPETITWSPSLSENKNYYDAHDCSGYGNHGTASASLETSINSPRYSHSTLFKDNKYIQTIRNNFAGMKNTYSLVYWAKHPTSAMSGKMVWGFYDSSNAKYLDLYPVNNKFTLNNGGVGTNLPFNVDCPTDGSWHHYAVVGDVNKAYLYIDGIYKGQTSSLYEIPNAPLVLSGWTSKNEYRWNDGQISDFRLYATTLSAAAIKELYQSSISFLDNGTLQCSEIVEKPTNIKYNQTGIVQAELLSEVGYINEMQIKTLSDGSAWARIFYHKNRGGNVLFTSASEVLHTTSTNKFSRLDQIYHFKGPSGKYEFMLNFVELPGRASMAGQYNRWKQTNAPQDEPRSTAGSEAVVTGYEEVSGQISWRTQGWGGLGCQNATPTDTANCYIDGSIGFGNWFYAIGAYAQHDSGIPGPNGGVEETELWVRIDNLSKLTKLSMFNGALQAHQIYEL